MKINSTCSFISECSNWLLEYSNGMFKNWTANSKTIMNSVLTRELRNIMSTFKFRMFSPIFAQFQYSFELFNIQFELSNIWLHTVYFKGKGTRDNVKPQYQTCKLFISLHTFGIWGPNIPLINWETKKPKLREEKYLYINLKTLSLWSWTLSLNH